MKNSNNVTIVAVAMLLMLIGGLSIGVGAIVGLSNKVARLQNELKTANNQIQAKEVEPTYSNSEIDTKFELVNTQMDTNISKINDKIKELEKEKKEEKDKEEKEKDLFGKYKVTKITEYNESNVKNSTLEIKDDGTIIVCGLRWGMTASSGTFPQCITFAKK